MIGFKTKNIARVLIFSFFLNVQFCLNPIQSNFVLAVKNDLAKNTKIKEELLPREIVSFELAPVDASELRALSMLVTGKTMYDAGQYEAAIELWEKALLDYRQKKYRFSESMTLSFLSGVHMIVGNYGKAIDYAQQGLIIARQFKDPLLEGLAYASLGSIYATVGDYTVSIKYSQAGLFIAKKLQKRYPKNFLYDYFQIIEGGTLVNLSVAYGIHYKAYDKAIRYAKEGLAIAIKVKNPALRCVAFSILGSASYVKKEYQLAIQYFEEGLRAARTSFDQRLEGYILGYMGLARFKIKQFAAAEKTLREGVSVWESMRAGYRSDENKVSMLDVQAKTYRTLQQVLIAENKPEAALEIAERGRARALAEILVKRSTNGSVEGVNVAPPNIQSIQSIAKTQNATLVEYSILYEESQIEEIQPSTKEATLLIWVVKPTGEISLRQVSLSSQNTLKQLVLSLLDDRAESLFQANVNPKPKLQSLHQLLIQPIADLLPTDPNASVIFIPQDVLYRVPFAALQDQQGQYLIERHTILSAPSIQVLSLTHQQNQRLRTQGQENLLVGFPRSGVVVGNPTGANLQAAEKEAITIASILGIPAITGRHATKSMVLAKMPNARIIHLATHGRYIDERYSGLKSTLAFAPEGQDNGLLTASEIFGLKLSASLVVLSACNSARGEITGEGVIGFSRAFIAAGAPSLVLSLWSIKDETAAIVFMEQFYQNLKRGQNKAQALRQVMLFTIGKGIPVRDWAGFTLIGESD